jgi:hypothetical protein
MPTAAPRLRPGLSPIRAAAALALLAALAGAPPAAGQSAGGIAIGARAATTGIGVELSLPVGARLGLRAAATAGSYDLEFESEDITYDGEVDLSSVLAVADLHPFAGGFRLSFGALIHDNTLVGSAPVRELLLREGITPPPGLELGRLVAEATVDPVAPYAGIGWGSAPRGAGGFSVSLDLGAAWHGEPEVDVRYAGPLPLDELLGQPLVDQLRAEEEAELEAELAEYDLFPVVAITLSYRF